LQLVREISIPVTDLPTVTVSKHQADNRFLECAEAAAADFLVTGNSRHFPQRWKTTQRVTARELLEIVGPKLLEGRD
jgi:predicted nucleic acid-binding protein